MNVKKEYSIINIHPKYNSEEEKINSYKEIALKIALEIECLKTP